MISMTERFRQYVTDYDMLTENGKVLLAVSGGIDSMVMTHLFLRSGYHFAIGHCNFKLRGEDSEQDELFVSKFAANHNIEFHSVKFNTQEFAAENGISVQMAARELRFSWLNGVLNISGCGRIALAHNLNDNCETFLINLVRGTGITGMTGIKPVSGNLIRPLLFLSRREIEEYRDKYDIEFREDRSNSETKYIRNRIRHNVLPELLLINPSFLTTISETTARIGEVNQIYSSRIDTFRDSFLRIRKDVCSVALDELMCLTPLNTILFELFREYGIGRSMVPELIKLAGSRNGSILNTKTHQFLKDRGMFIITAAAQEESDVVIIDSPDEMLKKIPGATVRISDCSDGFVISKKGGTTSVDLEKLKFPLSVRPWREGDFFYPLGMENRKKLSDFFIDNKFSINAKRRVRVLESDGKIVSLLGVRTDNRFRITNTTKRCIIIEFNDSADTPC